MRFKVKKAYGSYKVNVCPFCSRTATQKNAQGLDVCHLHTKNVFEEVKCTCGSWLEVRSGKFGAYFNCLNCGNMNLDRVTEIKSLGMKNKEKVQPATDDNINSSQNEKIDRNVETGKDELTKKKEITIDTNDMEYFS